MRKSAKDLYRDLPEISKKQNINVEDQPLVFAKNQDQRNGGMESVCTSTVSDTFKK